MALPSPLPLGIYEQLIHEYLSSKLKLLDKDKIEIEKGKIEKYDPQVILSRYLHTLILKMLRIADEKHTTLDKQILICNEIIQLISSQMDFALGELCTITRDAELLLAIQEREQIGVHSGGTTRIGDRRAYRPRTSIAESSLFTGSPNEPSLANEFKHEIRSSDRIDLLISFIKWSGIRLIIDDLRDFVSRGNRLRIITTSYTGATDLKAIEELANLPNTQVKISYDTDRTRLHAKTYFFHRKTGFSTAYIGSANISNPAMTSGLEWNVKITEQDSLDITRKIEATFDSYWDNPEFILYHHEDQDRLRRALSKERPKYDDILPVFDIQPYYFQKEILEKLQAERQLHHNYRNLVVAATGTGKTIISAFDYKSQITRPMKYPRLLFVAHREEILKQSLSVFRSILRDQNFGDLMVGGHKPSQIDHLFISIQSLNSADLPASTSPDYYDMIIVDEFHHAAAPSYRSYLPITVHLRSLNPLKLSHPIGYALKPTYWPYYPQLNLN
jgi:HKD family nuclease